MFSDAERAVYHCPHTGLYFDPLAVRRGLIRATKNGFNDLLRKSRSTDPAEAAEGEEGLLVAARTAFKLPSPDPKTGVGVLDSAVLDTLSAFTRWLKGKGETAQTMPTSAPCLGCPGG